MRVFEVFLNGEPYARAGVGEFGILSTFVTWVAVRNDTETDVRNPSGSTMLSVTGTREDRTAVHWGTIADHLKPGNVVTIRILETDDYDPGAVTSMLPPLPEEDEEEQG